MSRDILLIILIMTVVTYGARVLPFLLFRRMNISGIWRTFISLIPVALLAALVLPELVIPPEENRIRMLNPFLIAGIFTFIFARIIPNLLYSIMFGMVVFWGLDKII